MLGVDPNFTFGCYNFIFGAPIFIKRLLNELRDFIL